MKASPDITSTHLVKIAILDTGLVEGHKLSDSVQYKDFVDPSSKSMIDKTSHGTHSIDLVTKACPDALVYIARVFENNHTDEVKEPEQMAQVSNTAGFVIISTSLTAAGHRVGNRTVRRHYKYLRWLRRGPSETQGGNRTSK
jgi:hypothetical protein